MSSSAVKPSSATPSTETILHGTDAIVNIQYGGVPAYLLLLAATIPGCVREGRRMKPVAEMMEILVAARITSKEQEAIERVARTNDRTLSREIRRAIRYYLTNLEAAERALKAEAESEGRGVPPS